MADFWAEHDRMVEEELFPLMAQILGTQAAPLYGKIPARTSSLSGARYVEEIIEGANPHTIQERFRMPLRCFEALETTMLENSWLSSSKYVGITEKLAIFLAGVGCGYSNRELQDRFQHSGDTISHIFNEVLIAMVRLSIIYIRLLSPDKPLASRIQNNLQYYPYFKDCLGALDGTHIDAHLPQGEHRAFRNRKGRLSQNVLAVCSFDMEFLYVLAGWEGSAHDTRVLHYAVYEKGFSIPSGKYYLGDAGYTNSEIILTPYQGVRYHLKEQALAGLKPANAKELFNLRHSSLRNVIERSFGVLKRRFKILQKPPPFPFRAQTLMMYALCGLYNFIRQKDTANEDAVEEESDAEEDNTMEDSSSILPSTSSLPAMEERRNKIATAMWRDYQRHVRRRQRR